ncbi:AlpA family phage regulatory protein [Bordetella hinzii]|nr:AlpA family phage regulatory protein [Bordetella hinzii]
MKPTHLPPPSLATEKTVDCSVPTALAGYMRLPDVVAVCRIGKSTIWKWCAAGRFPKPIKLSTRISVWKVEDIQTWIAQPNKWLTGNSPPKSQKNCKSGN